MYYNIYDMKRLAFLFVLLFLLPVSFSQEFPATCFNERLDRNEIAIDCGGFCRGCTLEDLEKTQRILYPDTAIYEELFYFNVSEFKEELKKPTKLSTPFSGFESDSILKSIVDLGDVYVVPVDDINVNTFSSQSLKEVKIWLGDLIELHGINAYSETGESSPQFKIKIKTANETWAGELPQKKLNYHLIGISIMTGIWFILLLFYWGVYKEDIHRFSKSFSSKISSRTDNIRKIQARYILAQLWPLVEKEERDKARRLFKKLELKYRKIKKKDPNMTANVQEIKKILK